MTETATTDPLLTVVEVAERLGVSRSWVYQAMARGAISYVSLPAARKDAAGQTGRRIRLSVLEAFIDSNTQHAAAQT